MHVLCWSCNRQSLQHASICVLHSCKNARSVKKKYVKCSSMWMVQKMEEADVKNEAALQEVNDKFNNQLKLIHEGHDKVRPLNKVVQMVFQKHAKTQGRATKRQQCVCTA